MKPLLLFLLLSTAAWGQDSTTTKIFRDVYGNWYDSKGVVETVVKKPDYIHFSNSDTTKFAILSGWGSDDFGNYSLIETRINPIYRNNVKSVREAYLFTDKQRVKVKARAVNGKAQVLINNKWIEL